MLPSTFLYSVRLIILRLLKGVNWLESSGEGALWRQREEFILVIVGLFNTCEI